MDELVAGRRRLMVHQAKEWGEILLGFEARNRFDITDDAGTLLAHAAEEGRGIGAMLLRNLLGRCRACKIHVYGTDGDELARGEKPFRFYFHRMELFEGSVKVGAIQRRFSVLNRLFTLEDAHGRELLTLKSPLFRIWTFKLLRGDREVGRIAKRWGGALKEMFTDADTFSIQFFDPALPVEVRKFLVVAVFLVDFVCFENNTNQGPAFNSG
jgi:GNAT superfamily N-acetyltransferase